MTTPKVVTIGVLCAAASLGTTITGTGADIPKTIPDNNPVGVASTLVGLALAGLTDLNLIFTELRHTSVPDLHIELTSPGGTRVVLVKAFTESGILTSVGTPNNLLGTMFDHQAPTN